MAKQVAPDTTVQIFWLKNRKSAVWRDKQEIEHNGSINNPFADDIARRKGLRYREDILDNMGSDELIANLFRISQT